MATMPTVISTEDRAAAASRPSMASSLAYRELEQRLRSDLPSALNAGSSPAEGSGTTGGLADRVTPVSDKCILQNACYAPHRFATRDDAGCLFPTGKAPRARTRAVRIVIAS